MAKVKYNVKYILLEKGTGRQKFSGQIQVSAESETNAVVHVRKTYQKYDVEIVSVAPL